MLEKTLRLLRAKYSRVFFTPGNNEYRFGRQELHAWEEQQGGNEAEVGNDGDGVLVDGDEDVEGQLPADACTDSGNGSGSKSRPGSRSNVGGSRGAWQGFRDSIEKLERGILPLCERLGVETEAALIDDAVWIVPLFAWYQPSFSSNWANEGDDDYDKALASESNLSYQRGWLDFRRVIWPSEWLEEEQAQGRLRHTWRRDSVRDRHKAPAVAARKLRERNEAAIARVLEQNRELHAPVVSFSHFLPRRELLGFVARSLRPTLEMVVGDTELGQQIEQLDSEVHVYGHTHINDERTIGRIRYVQHSLGHPGERGTWISGFKKAKEPKLVMTARALAQQQHSRSSSSSTIVATEQDAGSE